MREGRYEHEAPGKPAALSSPIIVTRERGTAHFWRSVFGKTADSLVRQWPGLLGELQNRVSPLETLFHHLEELSISADTGPRRGMERGFRRERVLSIVANRLINAGRIRAELRQQDEEQLKTCEQEYRRLLAAPCLFTQQPVIVERFRHRLQKIPPLATAEQQIRTQLTLMLKDVQRELSQIKADRKKVNGKCATLSDMIQDLAIYLWRCQMIQVFYPVPARQYAFIRDILWPVVTPTCLACGQRHEMKNWRTVQARDHGRGRRVKIGITFEK